MLRYSAVAGLVLMAATPAAAQETSAFQGFHVEGLVGGDRVKSGGEKDNGIAYGVGAGYDVATGGGLVVGAEVEGTMSTTKECSEGVVVPGDKACIKAGRDLYAGARVGVQAAPGTLVYAKGGYTNARIKATYDDGATETSTGENADGFRVGAGIEQRFGSNTFLKGEYRYSDYEGDFSRHQVLVGVGLRF